MKNRNLLIYIYLFFSICNLFLFQKLEAKGKDNINATSYDSLIIKLNKLKDNDTNKIVILNNLFKLTDSIQFIQKAIKLSETIGYKRGLANSYFELGKYYCFKTNDNKSALSNLIISNHLADEVNNISVLIYTYLYIGYIYSPENPFKSKFNYEKSLELALKYNEKIAESYCYSALGNFYETSKNDFNLALDYYLKSLAIREKLGSQDQIASSINETSRIYFQLHNYKLCNELTLKGLKIAEKSKNLRNIVYFCDLLGNQYNRNKDYKNSLKYHLKSFEIAKNIPNIEIDNIAKDVANTYFELCDYKNASKYYNIFAKKYDSIKSKSTKNIFDFSEVSQKLENNLSKLKKIEKSNKAIKNEKDEIFKTSLITVSILLFSITILIIVAYIQKKRKFEIETQKLKAENELKENQDKFAYMIENISDVITLVDIDGKIIYESPSIKFILGYEPEELVNRSIFEFIHKDDMDYIISEFQKGLLIDGHREGTFLFRFLAKNNEYKYFEAKVNNQINNQNINALIVASRDVTESKKAEEIQKLARFSIENATCSIAWIKEDASIMDINASGLKLFGYSREQLLTLKIPDIDPNYTFDIWKQHWAELKEKGRLSFQTKQIRSNGEIIDVEVDAHYLKFGSFELNCAFVNDITERKKVEQEIINTNNELEQSFNKLSAYFNSTKESIYVINKNYEIIAFNKVVENGSFQLFNKRIQLNDNINQYVPINSIRNFKNYSAKAIEGEITYYEVCINLNNEDVWWEITYLPLKDGSGNIIGATLVAQNIDERKKSELELINAKVKAEESDRLKSSFLANMSHELRTPMNGILGFSEILKTETDIIESQNIAELINLGSKRLMETLNLILDFSLIESGVNKIIYEDFDLIKEINHTINIHRANAQAKGLYINVNTDINELYINSSLKAIYSILNNIINNAIKFTKNGGITIAVEIDLNNYDSSLDNSEANIILTISDTGIGIDEKYLEIIFEEFRQASEGLERSFEGTGLGLALTKKFTQLIKGKIKVESKLGIGSNFEITIPYTKPIYNSEIINKSENINNIELHKNTMKKILIVEDDDVSKKLIEKIINNKHILEYSKSAKEALIKVNNSQFDMILMDINLGNGPNGIFATKEIRKIENYYNIPIIATTSYVMAGDKEKFISEGCTDYISKPIEINLFIELIKKYLD